jgi:peptidase E
MNTCNTCNSTLLDKINFNNGQVSQICVNCDKVDPRNKEIVNATPLPLFFNAPIVPGKIYPRRLDIPELFPPKEEITTVDSKWSPCIRQNIMITDSTKPAFPLLDIAEREQVYNKLNYKSKLNGKIAIDWSKIIGYEPIKFAITQALNSQSKKKTHMLIVGAAGTSKTVFLKVLEENLEQQGLNVHYLDSTTLSSSGVIQYLFDNDVDYCLLDEIDKLEKEHQRTFLNLLESGVLQETKSKKIRKKEMKNTLFIATGNYIDKIMHPLLTRFMTFKIPEYSEAEFNQIGIKLLTSQYGKTKEIATYIVTQIWNIYTNIRHEKPNLRYARDVANLTDNSKEQIDLLLDAQKKYSQSYEE